MCSHVVLTSCSVSVNVVCVRTGLDNCHNANNVDMRHQRQQRGGCTHTHTHYRKLPSPPLPSPPLLSILSSVSPPLPFLPLPTFSSSPSPSLHSPSPPPSTLSMCVPWSTIQTGSMTLSSAKGEGTVSACVEGEEATAAEPSSLSCGSSLLGLL